MTRFEKVFDLPLARPEPDAPVETLWVLLTAFLHGEPAPRAGNSGFARGSRPVAEVYTAARAVEWLIRIALNIPMRKRMVRQRGMTSCSCFMSNHIYLAHEDFALLEWEVPFDFPPN